MPRYSYICFDGHETEGFWHMTDDIPLSVPCAVCGQHAGRDWGRINFAPPSTTGEQESMALGVQPGQEDDYRQDARKRGVEVDYRKDGTAVFRNQKAKLAYMKAYGYEYKPRIGAKEL